MFWAIASITESKSTVSKKRFFFYGKQYILKIYKAMDSEIQYFIVSGMETLSSLT